MAQGRDALRARLLSAHRPHRREARQLPSPDGEGGAITEFAGKTLVQGEPDASSFPSGGIRATFEARGYTAWDVTSPAYLLENPNGTTLCIPTAFVSWTGEALDKKTPLLRSMQALNKQAQRILKLFGHEKPAMVVSYARRRAGVLPDRQELLLRAARPAQRRPHPVRRQAAEGPGVRGSLLRRRSPSACSRFMMEVERELFKLGVPVKTRHNEVAPGQFESRAGVRERQHRDRPPAAGDGHAEDAWPSATAWCACCTRSRSPASTARASTSTSRSATRPRATCSIPGDTPHENAQFLVFCGAVIRAVHKHARPAARGRRHRRQRPPPRRQRSPAGDHLDLPRRAARRRVRADQGGRRQDRRRARARSRSASTRCRSCPKDAGDRNRTSPFAFTGNRFEFRAVGSGQSIGGPLIGAQHDHRRVARLRRDQARERAVARGKKLNAAIQERARRDRHASTAPWSSTATATRPSGTPRPRSAACRTTRPRSTRCPCCSSPTVIALFDKYKVLTPRELHEPLRDLPRAVLQDGQRRGQAHREDRQDDDLAGGAAVPEASSPRPRSALKAAGGTPDTTLLDAGHEADRQAADGLAGARVDHGASRRDGVLDEAKHFCNERAAGDAEGA